EFQSKAASMKIIISPKSIFAAILSVAIFGSHPAVAAVDYVSDEATAIAIAKAVLEPIVGEELLDGSNALPFYASLAGPRASIFYSATGISKFYNAYWYVENAPPSRLKWTTPITRVEIEKSSGRILVIYIPVKAASRPSRIINNVWFVMDTTEKRKKWASHVPSCLDKISPSLTKYTECDGLIGRD